jgi:hypothetical protein
MATRRLARGVRSFRRGQGGNGLIFALLGLLVSGLAAIGVVQNSRLQAHRDAGNAEATILDHLRNAANNAIFESMGRIQNGLSITKNGVTVLPVEIDGELVWRPSVADLEGMGYLPTGWSATRSTLNEAAYGISFHRVPAGCIVATCNIEGHVVLEGAIRSGDAEDGAVIGPILTRLGADAGVSLPMNPAVISGFGHTWTLANPVPGAPPGVVAVLVGTASSAFGQFVRIGDPRDPNLAGNLTVAGNTVFGDGGTTSDFKSEVRVDGHALSVRDGAGHPCVDLGADGTIDVACNGSVRARTGTFADGAGQVTTVGPTGVVAAGDVMAAGGFHTGTIDAFAAADPNAIVVHAGDLLLKNLSGTALLRVAEAGDAVVGRDLVATGDVKATHLTLSATVHEGEACSVGQIALMADGGLATCQAGQFRATTRYAPFGAACGGSGQQATDPSTGDTLICRGGHFASVSGLLSSRVYMAGFAVGHGAFIPVSNALPNGCPATAGTVPPQATIFLLPQTDSNTAGNQVLNRNAQWTGAGWAISLTDGAGAATTSNVVAEVYCLYP